MMHSDDWLSALQALRARDEPCVLVTLAAVMGSTPREHGTKMVVTRDGIVGSIGGGHLEHKATEHARAMLDDRAAAAHLETFNLGPHLGQCCGGKVSVLFEPFARPDFVIAIFGAGHVGKALVRILTGLPARIIWIDSRTEQFPADIPAGVERLLSDMPADEVKDLPPGTSALVMTHSHDLDLTLCERLLRRGDCRYIGLIGSETKWKRFEARLLHKGLPADLVRSIRCPIGIDGIIGKHPQEIAIAVAAELLLVRSTSTAQDQRSADTSSSITTT
jgi:xanthine dehydrogenase accessory factor